MRQSIIAVIVIAVIIGGAVIFGKDNEAGGSPSNNFYGNENSSVILVEYGDFQCPACSSFYPLLAQVKEKYKDEIKVEFRHFPLVQIHPNATAAHRAAEAAAKQGKFWEMHDLLYERQAIWSNAGANNGAVSSSPTLVFEGYAQELSLDMEQFRTDVKASGTLSTINADTALGKTVGVSGTPTFILNGKIIEDSSTIDSVEEFSALIEQAIADKNPSQ